MKMDENGWKGRNLIDMMKIHSRKNDFLMSKFIPFMSIYHCNENLSVKKKYHCDENSSLWWKFITMMKMDQFYENSLMWLKFSNMMKIHLGDEKAFLKGQYITVMKINHFDEDCFMC